VDWVDGASNTRLITCLAGGGHSITAYNPYTSAAYSEDGVGVYFTPQVSLALASEIISLLRIPDTLFFLAGTTNSILLLQFLPGHGESRRQAEIRLCASVDVAAPVLCFCLQPPSRLLSEEAPTSAQCFTALQGGMGICVNFDLKNPEGSTIVSQHDRVCAAAPTSCCWLPDSQDVVLFTLNAVNHVFNLETGDTVPFVSDSPILCVAQIGSQPRIVAAGGLDGFMYLLELTPEKIEDPTVLRYCVSKNCAVSQVVLIGIEGHLVLGAGTELGDMFHVSVMFQTESQSWGAWSSRPDRRISASSVIAAAGDPNVPVCLYATDTNYLVATVLAVEE
jgi:hypothetical protein